MNETDIILRLEADWVTKEELMEMLHTSERAVRSFIEDLNIRLSQYGKCVLSTASRKGYHIPSHFSEEDIALANRIDKELENKAISIFEHRKAIRNFVQYSASAKQAEKEIQLTLF